MQEAHIHQVGDGHYDVDFNCPWCGHAVTSSVVLLAPYQHEPWGAAICRQQTCKRAVLLRMSSQSILAEVFPSPRVRFAPQGLPANLAQDFREALQSARDGLRYGAALVGRRVLQAAVRDKGGTGPNLAAEIDCLKDELGSTVTKAAHQVRLIGNEAAHADQVTAEDVDELLQFTEMVLQRLYIDPAAIEAAEKKRLPSRGKGGKQPG